ncbi:hypothetical protein [Streptomyces sp. NPDC086766]|uniref:hypothetical protein n=1 Tax=Streptomyces sp. NPDC086766 TaxID=3365754 RepID=UPI003824AFDE
MADMQNIRTGQHCIFAIDVHLVFVTTFRHQGFTDAHLTRMQEITRAMRADFEFSPGSAGTAVAALRAAGGEHATAGSADQKSATPRQDSLHHRAEARCTANESRY